MNQEPKRNTFDDMANGKIPEHLLSYRKENQDELIKSLLALWWPVSIPVDRIDTVICFLRAVEECSDTASLDRDLAEVHKAKEIKLSFQRGPYEVSKGVPVEPVSCLAEPEEFACDFTVGVLGSDPVSCGAKHKNKGQYCDQHLKEHLEKRDQELAKANKRDAFNFIFRQIDNRASEVQALLDRPIDLDAGKLARLDRELQTLKGARSTIELLYTKIL